ncbi:histone acetyltransferase subunit [Metschnikowia bicuspidata var. bicuspidata NRRL YB-4993]|uniref:Histone acetyltransferase subunit n=1 Tax=Metschnikowia bicuspidata var. bicuspidata NRRL YB-4993 TaxID=869754 RepID=A0A1A0HAR1_9ASCO|nr:histone acetyltransferase subunit [Metschnikowia bicuspidata var. bicuspidata NRRL YB-4993]OBA21209.1 histone acetyltransferase subunit [Metschnikowia bicuspidata var. bicuspidata NRRL YB-4993]
MDDSQNHLQLKEEYELWRKNCRFMYDFVSETALTWPSLTIQWLPQHEENNAKLLLGTHTSGMDDNYLKLASTKLPVKSNSDIDKTARTSSKIKISKKIKTSSEINRARYMPQDPNLVAAINGAGGCEIFNLAKGIKELTLASHSENGYGLSWNHFQRGILLTGSDDKTCVISDVNRSNSEQFLERYLSHTDIVNDARWHTFDTNVFGSVSDDRNVYLFDTRAHNKPVQMFHDEASEGINSLAFSPFSTNLLAVGNQNSNISFLDLRVLDLKSSKGDALHTMMGHGDGITSMEFSPHRDGILASGSQDRRVILWDLCRIGEEQTQEDAEDGAPEIFMMHAGHTSAVTDLSWCPFQDWTLASTADDNILHLWKVSDLLTKYETGEFEVPRLE